MKPVSKKDIALAFQNLIISGKVREAYDLYIHPQFRHHNPYFQGDRESLLTAMEEDAKKFPNKIFEVKRALEDEDLVAIHSHLKLNSDMPEIVVVHIFRFRDNKIIEGWDIAQQMPEENINKNSMF